MRARRRYSIAVLGATGAVGREVLHELDRQRFPNEDVLALATASSEGETVSLGNRPLKVRPLTESSLADRELVFCALPADAAATWVPKALELGATVIDCSSWSARQDGATLLTPEANPEALAKLPVWLASPTASVVIVARVLAPLKGLFGGLVSARLAVLAPASRLGHRALAELHQQTAALLNFQPPDVEVLPSRLAFNCVPGVGPVDEDGVSALERRCERELKQLFDVTVSCQSSLTPVFVGLTVGVSLHFHDTVVLAEVLKRLEEASGVSCVGQQAPMPMDLEETSDVLVGRLRAQEQQLHMWIAGDNLRAGGATNMIRVAQLWELAHATAQA